MTPTSTYMFMYMCTFHPMKSGHLTDQDTPQGCPDWRGKCRDGDKLERDLEDTSQVDKLAWHGIHCKHED